MTVRLPRRLADAVARRARSSGLRPSDIVRAALAEYLVVETTDTRRPAERIGRLLGSVASGVPDLAERRLHAQAQAERPAAACLT